MREQTFYITTNLARRRIMMFIPTIFTFLFAAIIIFAVHYEPQYKLPLFESKAESGLPNPPKNFDYQAIPTEEWQCYIAATTYQQEDGSLKVYFTNPEGNEAYLMCEVTDSTGKILYKSGIIIPGNYVESLYPIKKLKNEAIEIEIKIYAFEPEYYYSLGTLIIRNVLQPY